MTDKTTPPTTGTAVPKLYPDPLQALDAAIEGARIASPLITGNDGALHALVPRGFNLTKLPDATQLPQWPQAAVTVDDRASLVTYTNRFSDERSILVADYDVAKIQAKLDWHSNNTLDSQYADLSPQPCLHSVTLDLRFSEEFARWNAIAGKLHDQADFARFLEENAADVQEPAAGHMIELSRDFEATVGQTYKSSTRLDNGDRRLKFESESRALNEVVIPQKFTLRIPIYNGQEPDDLTALFRWRATPGGSVQLGFEWHRLEYQRRAHFNLIAFTAAEETGLPVIFGRLNTSRAA